MGVFRVWSNVSCFRDLRGSVQFSPLADWVVGEHEGRFSRVPLPVFVCLFVCLFVRFAGGTDEQFWHGPGCSLVDVVRPDVSAADHDIAYPSR